MKYIELNGNEWEIDMLRNMRDDNDIDIIRFVHGGYYSDQWCARAARIIDRWDDRKEFRFKNIDAPSELIRITKSIVLNSIQPTFDARAISEAKWLEKITTTDMSEEMADAIMKNPTITSVTLLSTDHARMRRLATKLTTINFQYGILSSKAATLFEGNTNLKRLEWVVVSGVPVEWKSLLKIAETAKIETIVLRGCDAVDMFQVRKFYESSTSALRIQCFNRVARTLADEKKEDPESIQMNRQREMEVRISWILGDRDGDRVIARRATQFA